MGRSGTGPQPERLSDPRKRFPWLRRDTSPVLKNRKAETTQLTAGANTETPDDNKDAFQGARTTAADLPKDDMWAIAEEKLRGDPKKREKLEKYDNILEVHFKSVLKPIGTAQRRGQFLGFLNSEIEHLRSKESEIQLGRYRNKAKRFLKTAVDCVIATKDIITAAATPCLPASVACAGVAVLLSFCVQAADQRHLLFDGLNTISVSIRHIAEYESLLRSDGNEQNEEVNDSIINVCCNVIEFQARAACVLQASRVESAIRDAFKVDEWDKLLSAIKEGEARVKDCAERKNMNYVLKIFAKVDDLKHEISDGFSKLAMTHEEIDRNQKIDQLLQLLYNNACPYEDSKNRNRKRVTGTCGWFTDHKLFQNWNLPAEGHLGTPGLLFVTADPGCGKSVLSRYLIDEILPDDERTVCYFFFKDDFEKQKSSLNAICTLVHQLFHLNRHLITDAVLEEHRACGEKFVESFSIMWKTFVNAARFQETVCVLDALDECQDSDRNELINAITGTQVQGLKFLLTSRPYEHISRKVCLRPKAEVALIHLQGDRGSEADAIEQEIKLVVDSRINETADSLRLNSNERELIRKQFDSVPNRTYLWVTLIFDGLMEKKSLTTKKDIMNLTKSLPQGVYDTYEKLLKRSLDPEMTKILLHLILGAKRPLSLSEISVALALTGQQSWDNITEDIIQEDRIQDTIRNLCGLFVTVVDKRVYLLHQTAREFLVQDCSYKEKARSGHLSSPRNYDAAAITLIKQGLTLLLTFLWSIMQPIFHRIWLFLTNSWQHSMDLTYSNSVLAETCISCLQPDFAKENTSMFEYAAIYWADHYRQSTKFFQAVAAERTRDLCLPESCRQWTRIHYRQNNIPFAGTPLCLASALGLERAVEVFLLERGAELETRDKDGRTPLSWAAENGHDAVVKLLLEKGAELETRDNNGQTPLLWAAENGHDAVVKLLLEKGAELETRDNRYSRTPLSRAAGNGHDAVVKLLLEKGAELETRDNNGQTPLLWAAENRHDAVVKLLLEKGAELETKDKDGWTPLLWATQNGHDAVVKLLLEKGAELETRDNNYSRTPLLWATQNGHDAVVKLLLEKGAELETRDNNYSRTPLLWAAEIGHDAVVKLLLEKGAELETRDNNYSRTPLLWATQNGHDAVVKLLLEKGAELETRDNNYSRTPLSWAARNGHDAVVKLLLEKGAELETRDNNYGRTPLLWAAENGRDAVVKLLLEKGAELETRDNYGQTPLLWAAEIGHDAVVKLLLEKGAELETRDNYGRTPLLWAAEIGRDAVVKLLLEKGAELETRDNYGQTTLLWAAQNGHDAVVKLLLEKGAELETRDNYGQTPLSWAAENGRDAVVKLLLEKGAELETRDNNGQTPLLLAAQCGHDAVVKLLLEKGAELETRDNDGRTPLSWATQCGHDAVVKLLLEKGVEKLQ